MTAYGFVQVKLGGAFGEHSAYVNNICFASLYGATDNRYYDTAADIVMVSPGDHITQNSGAMESRFIPIKT